MIITANTNSFQEEENSPSESYSNGKLTATRTFRGPSSDRFAFIRDVMGGSYVDEYGLIHVNPPISYPDNPLMVLTDWSISNYGRPVVWGTGEAVSSLHVPIASECNYLECQITLTYGTPDESSGGGNSNQNNFGQNQTVNANDTRAPEPAHGTMLTIEESFGDEMVQVETTARKTEDPEDTNGFAANETKPTHMNVNVFVHEITFNWTSVIAPNWPLIYRYLGALNYHEFWGYARGAVKLAGLRKTSRMNLYGQWTYDLQFHFIAKTVHSQGYETVVPVVINANSIDHAARVKDDRLGIWNRIWLPETFEGTGQHWHLNTNDGYGYDLHMLSSEERFEDLFQYDPQYILAQ